MDIDLDMTQMLYLADQDFETAIIKMFKDLKKKKKRWTQMPEDRSSQQISEYYKKGLNGNPKTERH